VSQFFDSEEKLEKVPAFFFVKRGLFHFLRVKTRNTLKMKHVDYQTHNLLHETPLNTWLSAIKTFKGKYPLFQRRAKTPLLFRPFFKLFWTFLKLIASVINGTDNMIPPKLWV